MNSSILSYPERGKWGKSSWRGNCSGYIIKDLIEQFKPKLFVDICQGSGTSADVCRDFGVDYIGLDLQSDFDFTHDLVLTKLPRPADMVFSHPAYHNMIVYTNDSRDTSRCDSVDEFLAKSQMMLLNQREATECNQFYCSLIGDQRKNGKYFSYQSDFIKMMPTDELHNVIIKAQHNCLSDTTHYSGKNFVPITHEYLLIWKKSAKSHWQVCLDMATTYRNIIASTWRNAIRLVMAKLGNADLSTIYNEVEQIAKHLIDKNSNWKAKIRQMLQLHYRNVERGIWSVQ